ncbi:MAG: hypothetical protein V1667_00380 [bacterium]
MLGYLQKFNNLPDDLKQKVSNSEAMKKIEELEKKYNIPLAALIMKVMVQEVDLENAREYLLKENLTEQQAENLAIDLKKDIFSFKREKPQAKSANFFFSPEDEEEVRKLAEQIVKSENSAMAPESADDKLERIISQAQINFGSADLAGRFSQILRTYLRGIRNKLDTKAALIKPFSSGGLSFDEDSAEKVMALAGKISESKSAIPIIKPLPKIKIPELEKRDAAYDFSKLAAKLDTAHELAPLTPQIVKKEPEKKEIPAVEQNKNTVIKKRFESENSISGSKVKLEDVKYIPRVMAPIDEIKYMDLKSFRRLDNDPFKSADKIKSKINLFEEENYGKKLESIKLWRSSSINKLYLEIGNLSIGGNKPVDVIIEERKRNNQEYLTTDEFKAIMDLNKSLRF